MKARLRAALALTGLAPLLMAQAKPEKLVQCEVGTAGEARYVGRYAVVDGKLSLRDETTSFLVPPAKSWIDKARVINHAGTPAFVIRFDAKNEFSGSSFVDGQYVLKAPAKTFGLDIYVGKQRAATQSQPFTGAGIGKLEKDFPLLQFGQIRPLAVELMLDERRMARFDFVPNAKILTAQSQTLRAAMRPKFEATPFNLKLDPGGRADRYCHQLVGCFLTTAAVEVVGLPDDCWELRQLRAFRDRFAARGAAEARHMADYYAQAPGVVRAVSSRSNSQRTWLGVYFGSILPAAAAAQLGWDGIALFIYTRMLRRMTGFGTQ